MNNKFAAKITIIMSLFIFQLSSRAAPMSFDLTWFGVSFGNTTTASGVIILDNAALLNPGNNDLFGRPGYVIDFSIMAAGASSGNGSFMLADFGARTATGDIDWPKDSASKKPIALSPHGVVHHYSPVAILNDVDSINLRRTLKKAWKDS